MPNWAKWCIFSLLDVTLTTSSIFLQLKGHWGIKYSSILLKELRERVSPRSQSLVHTRFGGKCHENENGLGGRCVSGEEAHEGLPTTAWHSRALQPLSSKNGRTATKTEGQQSPQNQIVATKELSWERKVNYKHLLVWDVGVSGTELKMAWPP